MAIAFGRLEIAAVAMLVTFLTCRLLSQAKTGDGQGGSEGA
jgi:hypothetical protein